MILDIIQAILTIVVWAGFYFIPTFVAISRKHKNQDAIAILNLCTGWILGIGWVASLIWALTDNVKKTKKKK